MQSNSATMVAHHCSFLHFTHSHIRVFLFIFFSLATFANFISCYSTSSKFSYSENCAHIIPASNLAGYPSYDGFPSFSNAYVVNAEQILAPNGQIIAYFRTHKGFKTVSNGFYKMDSSVTVRTTGWFNVSNSSTFEVPVTRVRFQLSGFWDSGSGKLCMVGYGLKRLQTGKRLRFDVVFKMTYPSSSNITTSLITGTLESLNVEGGEGHFNPIWFTSLANMRYKYTLAKKDDNGLGVGDDNDRKESSFHSCSYFASMLEDFKLVLLGSSHLDKLFGFLPKFMSFNTLECSDHRMIRALFGFSNADDNQHGYNHVGLSPSRTLVAEGSWDAKKNQFRFVACRILNVKDSPSSASIGDCSIGTNFTFLTSLDIRSRSVFSGHIWSNKSVNEQGSFSTTKIQALEPFTGAVHGMKYKYTEIEKAKKYCAAKKDLKQKGKSFPNLYPQDLSFDMTVVNEKGQSAWGMSHPVFVGSHLVQYANSYIMSSEMDGPTELSIHVNDSYGGSVNLTYLLEIHPMGEFKVGSEILSANETMIVSAEGIYYAETGHICMVGCWNRKNNTMDCETFIDIQIPSLDSNGSDSITGTIESKREKSDLFYFDRLHLSSTSLMKAQVSEAYVRMDIEIIMVLVSNTLTCIFVVLQLFHVRRNPNVLPFISLVMLALITLGHLIPLLTNMEAFFISSPNKRIVLFEENGWFEINEVLVRVITMLAFLLEFRLLQLTWHAKSQGDDTSKPSRISEKKVICYLLPLYIAIALIAWLVKLRDSQKRSLQHIYLSSDSKTLPYWHNIKSYAGFVLDAFLLPQIMFNVVANSRDVTLSMPYYGGTTIIRLLPHGYDLFRAHSAAWGFDRWYLYADYGMNYYSTSWNILISCLGVLFAVILYLQQRFGGRSVLPKRFRTTVAYEEVPTGL